MLILLCGVLCSVFAQGTSARTVSEAVQFFEVKSHEMIAELEKLTEGNSQGTGDNIKRLLGDLKEFVADLEEYSKSTDFQKNKNKSAKPDGKFAKKFSGLENSYSALMATLKTEQKKEQHREPPDEKNPVTKEQFQNKSTLEEKMDELINVQDTNLLINSITLVLILITLLIIVFRKGNKYAGNNSDSGIGSEEIKKINSTLANLDHRLRELPNQIPPVAQSELEKKLGELDTSVNTVSKGINTIIVVLKELKDGRGQNNLANQSIDEKPAASLQSPPTGTLFNRSPNDQGSSNSALIRYRIENKRAVQESMGAEKPVFAKDPRGEFWINEVSGELSIEESSLSEFNDPTGFLSMFFELSPNGLSRNPLFYTKKAKVKRDGQKWRLEYKGELN